MQKVSVHLCEISLLFSSLQKCLKSMTGVLQNFLSIFGKNGLFHTNDAVVTKMATDVNTVVAEILDALGVSEIIKA